MWSAGLYFKNKLLVICRANAEQYLEHDIIFNNES